MEKDKVIKMLDSVVGALSLNISNPDDVLKFEETYTVLRETMRDELTEDESRLIERSNALAVPFEFEPARRNRFLLEFPDNFNLPAWVVSEVELPSMSITTIRHGYQDNHLMVRPIGWSNLRVKFYELIGPSVSRNLMENIENRRNFNIQFSVLDPTGEVAQRWTIDVNSVHSIDFSNYSQSDDGMCEITVSFNVNFMTLN